jgi:signal transduction histidine kinase
MNVNQRMRREVANCGCSSEPHIGLLPPRHRESRNGAAAEDRAATKVGLGIAEIRAMVGGLIRQGRPLPVVLTNLCQLFDATVKGYSSSVLLLDRTGARVRNAAAAGLPASYLTQLEGKRIRWIDSPFGPTINAKTPVIVVDPLSDAERQGQEAAAAAAPGLRLQEVSPILSLTGEPLGIFAVYQRERNVSGCHTALIAQFTHVASAAIERMRSDEALAAIAHEVNQPLAGIVTNASTCRRMLAADPPDVEGARETARRTIRDAERASEIVKRLRALFCQKVATRESLDLNEATREVVAQSLSELERNKVNVRTELAGELPPVPGDRVQLQQVILNLLLNASDAMSSVDDRPRQLLIRTERHEEDRVRLSVQDTGVGFKPHGVDRLFDAFYTTKSGGMGIGLSVSRFIIESHKGRLWATPNDGPGATFSFSIPCERKDVTAVVTTRSLGAIQTSAVRNAEKRHVRSL